MNDDRKRIRRAEALCAALCVWAVADGASAATYHVSVTGDDAGSGDVSSPWRTLRRAASSLAAGDTVLVADGQYDEVVTIATSGSSETTRVTFRSENARGAKVHGFVIRGDYVTVDGFDIEAAPPTNWLGVRVNGSDHVQVLNSYVHECPMGGISFHFGADYAEARRNHMHHNGQWGLHLLGSFGVIEDNEISETVQHHPKGDEPGFTGHDADGLRIFGDNHVIRGNFIHDIANWDDPGNSRVSVSVHGGSGRDLVIEPTARQARR